MNEASFENKHNLRKAETVNEFEAVTGGNFESHISKLSLNQSLKTWESKAETCKVLVSGIAYFSDASALACSH